MKHTIAFFALFASALCIHVCFPDEFTTDQVIYQQTQQDVYTARIFFSAPLQKERIDFDVVVQHDKPANERISFLFDYPKGKWFEIHYLNSSAYCNVYNNLTGTLTPRCLSKNAKHRGTVLLGGVLIADNYIETIHDQKGEKVRVDILADANLNVPIRAFFRDVRGITREEFWNFKESVHHDAFIIPSICKGEDEKDSETAKPEHPQFYFSGKARIN